MVELSGRSHPTEGVAGGIGGSSRVGWNLGGGGRLEELWAGQLDVAESGASGLGAED